MSSFVSSQENSSSALDRVRNLLSNMGTDISSEQKEADIRNNKDTENCKIKIAEAEETVRKREKDVQDLEAHIKFLKNEIAENEADKKSRQDRIAANIDLLAKFKQQRCDNNILFVKQLREHMEGVDILNALKQDVNDYFAKRKQGKVNTSFIERFAEFSHLLSEENRLVFVQLSQAVQNLPDVAKLNDSTNAATATKQRTEQEVGAEHVDNKQGKLEALKHVEHQTVDVYADELHAKINKMIDGLVSHLEDSRKELTKNEIQAAEDFAKFQTNVEKENTYLAQKIVEITNLLVDLNNRLNTANGQLAKRQELLNQAREDLRVIKEICDQKRIYYEKETKRRENESQVLVQATNLFNDIISKLSKRVQERANNIVDNKEAGNKLQEHVAPNVPVATQTLQDNVKQRNAIVF